MNENWYGELPDRWEVAPNRKVFVERKDNNRREDAELLSLSQYTGISLKEKMTRSGMFNAESLIGYKIVEKEDLVMNIMLAWNGSQAVSKYEGVISPAYAVFKITDSNNPWYFHYLMRIPEMNNYFESYSTGLIKSRLRLYPDVFMNLKCIIPPRKEQDQVVRYLDWKVASIDKLINAQEKQIELFKEQRMTVIKESLENINTEGRLIRLRYATKILRGKFSHRPRNDPRFYDGKYPFIQTGEVARAGKYIYEYRQTLNEQGLAVSKMFPKGTLTMTIAANIGDVAILNFDACFPDSIIGFVPNKEVDLDYLYYSLLNLNEELLLEAPVSTQGNLNIERVSGMFIKVLSLQQQKLIVNEIEKKLEKIEILTDKLNQKIKLFKEYRTRLISDVVTGKLDVRDVVIPKKTKDNE